MMSPHEYISAFTLYIETPAISAPTKAVIHLDDIRITGRLQDVWKEEWQRVWDYYTIHAEKEGRAQAKKRIGTMRDWSRSLRRRSAAVREPAGAGPALLAQYRAALAKAAAALEAADPLVKAIEAGLESSSPFTADVHEAELTLGSARFWLDAAESCGPYAREQQDPAVVTYTLDPTRSHETLPAGPRGHIEDQSYTDWTGGATERLMDPAILPEAKPVAARAGHRLVNFGARGLFVPYAFAIETDKKLENLTFAVGPISAGNVRLEAAIDLRVVAPVYISAGAGKEPFLKNVMLVHDPEFVRTVGKAEGYNRFKNDRTPDDAATMQPITIEAGRARQFYLLVKPAADAKPGVYAGIVSATSDDGTELAFALELEVLPFDLEPTPNSYTAYCVSFWSDAETIKQQGGFGGRTQFKTFEQLEQDFISQAEHGFNTLFLRSEHVRKSGAGKFDYSPLKAGERWDFTDFDRLLDAAVKAGLTRGPFCLTGGPSAKIGPPDRHDLPHTPEEMVAWIDGFVPLFLAHCKERGYPTPSFMGADEWKGEMLKSIKPGYEAIRKAGGLVTIACDPDFLGILGPDLVRPILCGGVMDEEREAIARSVQAKGMPFWIYNCPATNVYERPSAMRRRYGLAMWRNGENGAAPWAYDDMRGGEGDTKRGYANLATTSYGTFCLAFPTWSGRPIDTLTYEALREGIYDTRYMATLETALAGAKKGGKPPALVAEVEAWLKSFSVNDDLQRVRRTMADFIVALRKAG